MTSDDHSHVEEWAALVGEDVSEDRRRSEGSDRDRFRDVS